MAELPNTIQLEVTAFRLPEEIYLRPMARGYWGSTVRVGPEGAERPQTGSKSYAGLFGGTVLFAGDNEGLGPLGLSLSAGLLVGRAEAPVIGGDVTYVAPMLLLGFDLFPPLMLYCWFVNDECKHHVRSFKN